VKTLLLIAGLIALAWWFITGFLDSFPATTAGF
jgi:hypothetical protein